MITFWKYHFKQRMKKCHALFSDLKHDFCEAAKLFFKTDAFTVGLVGCCWTGKAVGGVCQMWTELWLLSSCLANCELGSQAYNRKSNKWCALKQDNEHIVSNCLYDKSPELSLKGMFAFKTRAFNSEELYCCYYCVWIRHWNSCIRNKSYMAMQGMLFLLWMFHEIILHPHTYFILSVTLYCMVISLLHKLLFAMMALYRTDWRTCTMV